MFDETAKEFVRSDFPDAYINDIRYDNSPFAIGDPQNGVRIEFEYFMPFYENNPSRCMNETPRLSGQLLLISTENDEDFTDDFDVARYDLAPEERRCGVWLLFNHSAVDFIPEPGSSFGHSSTRLGAIDFEFANVYVKEIFISGSAGSVRVW